MSKKKKRKNTSKTGGDGQRNRHSQEREALVGDLSVEGQRPGLSAELTEAIDAAFDEGLAAQVKADIDAKNDAESDAATVGKTSAALAGVMPRHKDAKRSPLKTLFEWGGSMVIAILLMALLMIVLGWATFVENAYGPGVSQFAVYRVWWFDLLLALLGVNVLCSMLARLPWRRGHVPFVVAHVGILILLIGCLVTSRYGIEAQLTVYEGELGRFAQKTSGDEIGIEIIDFRKAPVDAPQSDSVANEPEESAQERWTRERLAAERDRTKIKSAGFLLKPELDALNLNERLRLPVTLGPMSWREYESKNWFVEGRKFAHTLYYPMLAARRSSGCIYDKDGVRVELLDYMADSRMKPARQLKLLVNSVAAPADDDTVADKDEVAKKWTTYELPLGLVSADMQERDPYMTQLPMERISYRLAKSNAETEAFLEMIKQPAEGTWGSIVLRLGGNTHLFAVDDLIARQSQFRMSLSMTQNRIRELGYDATEMRLQLLDPAEDADVDALKERLAEKESEIEEQETRLAELNSQIRMPIGETGLTLELTTLRLDYALLVVHCPDETRHIVALAPDQPLTAMVPEQLGMQAMYLLDPVEAGKQPEYMPSASLGMITKPRLDLMQGRDGKLYYRYWDGRRYSQSGELPTDQTVTPLNGDDGLTLNVAVEDYEPQNYPGLKLVAEPYSKPGPQSMGAVPCVMVRVQVDGIGDETYWLQKTPFLIAAAHLQEHQVGYVSGHDRTLAVTFPQVWLDLGFSLYLHKFERKLEPGIGMPLHYSSLVSVYPIDDETADTTDREPLNERVLIRMNQPSMFADQTTGRKYRVFQSSYQGPYHPGMGRYETNTGGYVIGNETQPRESIYASTLTANYDPGRGLKYLGCLMIVLGSLALFYTKKVRRKIGLTPLESSPTENDAPGNAFDETHDGETSANGYAAQNAMQRSPKRVLRGHAMMLGLALLVAFNLATGATVAQNDVSPENADEIEAVEPVDESPVEAEDEVVDESADGSIDEATDETLDEPPQEQQSESETPEAPAEDEIEIESEIEPETAAPEDEPEIATIDMPPVVDGDIEDHKDHAEANAPAVVPPMPEAFDASNVRVSNRAFDWRAWEELPVFYDGRVMPLATFARITVTNVCGRSDPTLECDERVLEAAVGEKLLTEREAKRIRAKFANGPRKFRNSELVFSWLVEPEVWEYIPFLAVENLDLRTELNPGATVAARDLPKYASPYQVKKHAVELQRMIDQSEKIKAGRMGDAEIEKLGEEGIASLQKAGPAASELHNIYSTYRTLTNEANALPAYRLYLMLAQADRQVQTAYRMQLTLERLPIGFTQLGHAIPFSGRNELGMLQQDIGVTLDALRRAMRDDATRPVTPGMLEADLEKRIATFDELLPQAEAFRDAMFALDSREMPQNTGLRPEVIRMLRGQSEQLYYSMRQSRQWCEAACLAIYDCGAQQSRPCTLQIYPALVAESVKADRSYPVLSYDGEYSETKNRVPTWLTLHTFLFGSDDMIRRFAVPGLPEHSTIATNAAATGAVETTEAPPEIRLPEYDGTMLTLIGRVVKEGNPQRTIRKSFHEMAIAYLAVEYHDLYAPDDVGKSPNKNDSAKHFEAFNRASLAFANNLRANAEATAELRTELVPPNVRDDELLAKTAYPTPKLMRAEYNYERMQPFYLMWLASAAALVMLLVSALVSLVDHKDRRTEATFFWLGFVMLILSEAVTLVGACYRAYITGWAPVTNMFETIVLMAFSVAVIGIWYAFQPLFGERLLRAWRVAALPKSRPSPGDVRVSATCPTMTNAVSRGCN